MDKTAMYFGAIVAGIIGGIIPLWMSASRGQKKLGQIGFFSCLAGGFIGGFLLAVLISIIFIVLILKASRKNLAPSITSSPAMILSEPSTHSLPSAHSEAASIPLTSASEGSTNGGPSTGNSTATVSLASPTKKIEIVEVTPKC